MLLSAGVRSASSVLSCPLEEEEDEMRILSRLTSIMDDTFHLLHQNVKVLCSALSSRRRHTQWRTERLLSSLICTVQPYAADH